MIQIRRVYDRPRSNDGYRILVDRLWPRGIKKSELPLDAWEKALAPSDSLRREFAHDPARWARFRSDYRKELASGEAREKIRVIAQRARKRLASADKTRDCPNERPAHPENATGSPAIEELAAPRGHKGFRIPIRTESPK